MAVIHAEWAGAERAFALRLGEIIDLEEACGQTGFGAVYLRVARHAFFIGDITNTIRLGLVGGGMDAGEARRLTGADRFDATPVERSVSLALQILLAAMQGIRSEGGGGGSDPERALRAGAMFASFIKVGITPDQVRAMAYADFVNAMREMHGPQVEPPTEEEFVAMKQRYGFD